MVRGCYGGRHACFRDKIPASALRAEELGIEGFSQECRSMHSSLDVIAINQFPTSTLNNPAAGVIHVSIVHGYATYLVRFSFQPGEEDEGG